MDGTTLCPHCETRFKIANSQLEAHHGMVRCGHCLQAFDARPNFISDQPHPQLELEMLEVIDTPVAESAKHDSTPGKAVHLREIAEESNNDIFDLSKPVTRVNLTPEADENMMTLAEQVEVVEDEPNAQPRKQRTWLWAVFALMMMTIAAGQGAYFFRSDLAARLPDVKPVLQKYCEFLNCTVPLPQKNDLVSIESSSLEADPNNGRQITLNALLRNRASFPLAFPNLELTLNDRQDKPVARRAFKPSDYLPPLENEQDGMQPNHELSLKLLLDTADLNPNGYRLVVLYPAVH